MKKLLNTALVSLTAMTFFTSCLKQDQQTVKSQSQQKSSSVLQSGGAEVGYAPKAATEPEVQMTPAPSIIEIAAQAEQKIKDDKVKAVVKPVVAPVAPAAPAAVEPEKKTEVVAAPPSETSQAPAESVQDNKRSIVGIWVTPKGGDSKPNAQNWFPIGYAFGAGDVTSIIPMNRYVRSASLYSPTVIAATIAELQKMVDYSFGSQNKNYEIRVGTFACENPEGLGYMIDPKNAGFIPAVGMIDALFAFSHHDGGQMIGGRHAWSMPPVAGAFRSDGNEFIDRSPNVHIKLRDNAPYPAGTVPARLVDKYLATAAVDLDEVGLMPSLGMDKVTIMKNPSATGNEGYNWNPSFLWNGLYGGGTQMKGPTFEALKTVLKLQYPKDASLETYKTKIKEQLGSYFSLMETVARASKDPERLSACEGMGLKVSATEPLYPWEPVPMNNSCHALFGEFSMGEFGESFYALINPSEVPPSVDFAAKMKALAKRLFMASRHEAGHEELVNQGLAPRPNCFGKENSKMSPDSTPQVLVIGKSIQ